MNENIYPAGPESVCLDLSKPVASYKQQVWLAVSGLCIFMVLYLFLAYWFLSTGYTLISSGLSFGEGAILGFLVGVCALFLAVFMIKALFFVRKRAWTSMTFFFKFRQILGVVCLPTA